MKFLVFLVAIGVSSALPRSFLKVPGGGKIVGGVPAAPKELPFQLTLQKNGNHICGAILIHSNWALTAAHCVSSGAPNQFKVVAGEHDMSVASDFEQLLSVSRIYVHKDYNSGTFENDMALLRFGSSAVFNEHVDKICLPKEMAETVGIACVSGWGTMRQGGPLATILQKVDVPVVSDADCQRMYPQEKITANMICAGYAEGGKDSCQGDSGGPLVSVSEGATNGCVVGVVSWGYGCAAPGYPGVYTEVAYYIPWIEGVMSANP